MGGEDCFFIHIFGGFRKPPKIWAFFQTYCTERKKGLFSLSEATPKIGFWGAENVCAMAIND